MRAWACVRGFRGTPAELPVERHGEVYAWHLHDGVSPVDFRAPFDTGWMKSRYPVNYDVLRQRIPTAGSDVVANIEIGQRAHDLTTRDPRGLGERAAVLRHVGDIKAVCARHGVNVRGYYGDAWHDSEDPERGLESDVAEWALAGMPELAVCGLYNVHDGRSLADAAPRIRRNTELCREVNARPAYFVTLHGASGAGVVTPEHARTAFEIVGAVAATTGAEVFLWGWGDHKIQYETVRPVVETFAEVMLGKGG